MQLELEISFSFFDSWNRFIVIRKKELHTVFGLEMPAISQTGDEIVQSPVSFFLSLHTKRLQMW